MSDLDLKACQLMADALGYPTPELSARLSSGLSAITDPGARKTLTKFVQATQNISLGAWEELYTRTFDLNPAVAPYLGYHIWGDGYPRGNFMAVLNRAYRAHVMEDEGELPDHLSLVLRYLGTGAPPPPELGEVFAPATQKMLAVLSKSDKDNLYVALLEAICQTVVIQAPEAR